MWTWCVRVLKTSVVRKITNRRRYKIERLNYPLILNNNKVIKLVNLTIQVLSLRLVRDNLDLFEWHSRSCRSTTWKLRFSWIYLIPSSYIQIQVAHCVRSLTNALFLCNPINIANRHYRWLIVHQFNHNN